MKVHDISVYDIKAYENNPRRIPDNAVDAVAASIKNFGFINPVVIDKDNVIVCGHTRLLAAKKLGIQEIPCVLVDNLTPEQVQAFRVIDNKTSELSAWDFEKLELELEELNLNFDMGEFGFSNDIVDEEDISSFFTNTNPDITPENKTHSKIIICPHCGAKIKR